MKREKTRLSELKQRQVQPQSTHYHPAYVVWELTLRCDHACRHCGSRALVARPDEINTEKALGIVSELAQMGAKEVVLIGGEAYLHPGFLDIVEALASQGMTPVMTTGGMGITSGLALKMAQAGMKRISVSVDGLEPTHNMIRKRKDSFQQTMKAMQAIQAAGMDLSANTHFNRLNQGDLEALYAHFVSQGVRSWQIQITAALGRAADQPEMLFQPWDLIQFLPRVAELKRQGFKEGLLIMPGNNLGYFGPEEATLRSALKERQDFFQGCQAGKFVMGIESDGGVKGCPSLPSLSYVGGNLKKRSLQDIWEQSSELAFRREPTELWGYCATCPFSESCQGGCNFTAHALFGRPGNNPYCHFRAKDLARRGRRERLQLKENAPGQPFDHAIFDLIEEPFCAPDSDSPERALRLIND